MTSADWHEKWHLSHCRRWCTDPDDGHALTAVPAADADLIASGDRCDLLPLGRYEGIAIVTAREALERLAV